MSLRALFVGLPVVLVAGLAIFWSGSSGTPPPATAGLPTGLTQEDRAVAIGVLLDSPRTPQVVDEALVLAEKLRRHYGIDSGNAYADRQEAAERAQHDFLDRLVFTEEEIAESARALGYSLDPAMCANWCDNAREAALVELEKRALLALVAGEPWPGTLADEAAAQAAARMSD
jgi:hypothetical protein